MNKLYFIANKIGIDKSIAYSSCARVIQGLSGVVSMFFISTFLSGIEQGFYFTFGSIVALQVFFELGLTGIMTQYVAHEASHLTLSPCLEYSGEFLYKSRLASLTRLCLKWYTILGVSVFVFLLFVGIIYFNKYANSTNYVSWKIPWIIVCIATSLQLFIAPFTSILTGLGFVKETSKISFFQQLFVPASIWVSLCLGLKLYVIGIGYLLSFFIWLFGVYNMRLYLVIVNLLRVNVTYKVNYIKEIFPYQWKIALSWISGYFTFQLFNPVLFATEGAIVAGQMGMTLQALNAISSLSMSWLNTKIPLYSRLISLKDYFHLDSIFNKTLKQMNVVCAVLLVLFLLFVILLRLFAIRISGSLLADRFLDICPLILLMLTVYCNQYINSWATYLRCHKKEPFLINSVVVGLLSLISTFYFGYNYGLYGVVIGYCVIKMASLPWGYSIFKTKKYEWHK